MQRHLEKWNRSLDEHARIFRIGETHYDTHVVSDLSPVTFSDGELSDELKYMNINRVLVNRRGGEGGQRTSLMYGLIEFAVIGSASRIRRTRKS